MKLVKDIEKTSINQSGVTDKDAEEAFKTILKWIGENPEREGLKETPKRENEDVFSQASEEWHSHA